MCRKIYKKKGKSVDKLVDSSAFFNGGIIRKLFTAVAQKTVGGRGKGRVGWGYRRSSYWLNLVFRHLPQLTTHSPHMAWVGPGEGAFTCQANRRGTGQESNPHLLH